MLAALLITGSLLACAGVSVPDKIDRVYLPPSILSQDRTITFDELLMNLVSARVVLVGESHDRFDHHLNQLEIVRRLHESYPNLAIGLEQFQQPFQHYLDAHVRRQIDVQEMLRGTEYYARWKYDFRLYEPILSYAREHQIPVVALNLPQELTRKVAVAGLEQLTAEEAAQLPEIDRSDQEYRDRLRQVFDDHPTSEHGGSFEDFYTVQLLWDEGMAARAATYLNDNPEQKMVILAGRGHIEHGAGIPLRLARRISGAVVTIIQNDLPNDGDDLGADYVLHSEVVTLPKRGLLGVLIDTQTGGTRIRELSDTGAAKAVGVEPGDVIVAVDGRPVKDYSDLRSTLWNKLPGDRVRLAVRRDTDRTVVFDITLR